MFLEQNSAYLVEYMMKILCLELPHLYAQSITTEVKVKVEVDVKVETIVEVKITVYRHILKSLSQ